ncbi:33K protein [Raptor adenovirus 1]|uniref:33K protein n=1 Tax=Raptor adenovirus 1 TaxID=1520002 RepID=F4MI06_9ADEN|nr:33K protein [Raptor adenovirus 1]AEC32101.1 33K protein [Raptor adenovirus 1]
MLSFFHSPVKVVKAAENSQIKGEASQIRSITRRKRRIPGQALLHESTYQEIIKLRKEVWITIRNLKDYIYKHNISEELHIQNRTINSILAKHATCSNLNSLFKMLLDAQALKYQYENKTRAIPDRNCERKRR